MAAIAMHATTEESPEDALRRATPRIDLQHPILLRLDDSTNIQGTIENLSQVGLRVLVARDIATRLQHSAAESTGPLAVAFIVHLDGEALKVIASCRLVYVDLVTDSRAAVGLTFTGIRADGRQNLRRFVEASLIPAGDF